MIMQAMGTMDEMPTAIKGSQNGVTKRKGTLYSSATVKLEKQPCEAIKAKVKLEEGEDECSHEKKRTLQNLIQNEHKEYVTALRGEHNCQNLK